LGVSIAERIRDIGSDSIIRFDDLSKHSRSYRQIHLLQQKLPTRDAFPSDISNVHSSLSERASSMNKSASSVHSFSSISALPIIETTNNDTSESTATNVISTTDGQSYMSKSLLNPSVRPAIDSSLSVSRVGSNAQLKLIKLTPAGIKNPITTLRNSSNLSSIEYDRLTCLNHIFYQDHLFISEVETSLILLLVYRNDILFNNLFDVHRSLFILSLDYVYFYYILSIMKTSYSLYLYSFMSFFISYVVLLVE